MSNPVKKFHIRTLGCKVNQYESQAMRELLIKAGLEESGAGGIADIYIVNTCTVTAEADRESRHVIRRFHKDNPDASIVVTGCLTERDAPRLSMISGISVLLKNSEKNRIVDVVYGSKPGTGFLQPRELAVSDFKDHSKAYIKIQDGCENRCAYCKVPLVRSRLASKSIKNIISEVEGLVRNGFKEIVLTGICLGAWGGDARAAEIVDDSGPGRTGLVDVLEALNRLEGDFRIRLSSIESRYITIQLVEFMVQSGRICPHLHIPFQSGDDVVLKLMNRPYTSTEYRKIVKMIRSRMPNIALTTDILVGFPGESDESFNNTMNFISDITPSRIHVFTFSRREGTSAYNMPFSTGHSILKTKEKYDAVRSLACRMMDAYRKAFLGMELKVLVETKRDRATGLLKGYSDNYIQMMFAGPDDLMRNIVPVKVAGFDGERTLGEVSGLT